MSDLSPEQERELEHFTQKTSDDQQWRRSRALAAACTALGWGSDEIPRGEFLNNIYELAEEFEKYIFDGAHPTRGVGDS